jgi:murein DD-endopeptidase MepM/ murein hydrolase activator NlpD
MRLLSHRITIGNQTFEVAPISLSTVKPIALGAPLHGTGWIASNGPGNNSVHRRALTPINGTATIAQRFAIDWTNRGADSNTYAGDPNQNRSYHAYGAEVLSVADAVVVAAQDSIPENTPGASRAVPITPETIGGNYIVLDLGSGTFATYLHLQPRSLRVKKGDHIVRGQILALVGNSGNSTEPHLHFQVTDGTDILRSEGLPYVIDSYDVENAAGNWESRSNELPIQNDKIRWP